MQITINVPDENINGALEAPLSRYWAREAGWDPVKKEGHVVDALDEGAITEFDEKALRAALLIMAARSPSQLVALASGAYDGVTGDLLLQYMAFGQVRYA